MTEPSEKPSFEHLDLFIDGKPVDAETFAAHQRKRTSEEIRALAQREPMWLMDENGDARQLGTGRLISGSQSRPLYFRDGPVPPMDSAGDVYFLPRESRFVGTEELSTGADPYFIKGDVTVSDTVEAIKKMLPHPQEGNQ